MSERGVAPIWLLIILATILAACSNGAAQAPAQSPAAPQAASTVPARPTAAAATQPAASTAAANGASSSLPATQAETPSQPAAAGSKRTLIVFAAASLTGAFEDLARQFEAAHPGVKVIANYAGSQQLSAQLVQGAPADVFASANAREMQTAIRGGSVISGTQEIFARNRLAVIFPKDNPAKIGALADLARPGLKLDLADRSVPAGQYTLDMLAKMSRDPAYGAAFQANVLKNAVSYETDVKEVVSKVSLGEADAGVVYTTDASAAQGKLGSLPIPDQFNQIAIYPIAPVVKAPQPDLAKQFVAFVLSPAGQQTLARYGFITGTGTESHALK